jgi:hypothetical protein
LTIRPRGWPATKGTRAAGREGQVADNLRFTRAQYMAILRVYPPTGLGDAPFRDALASGLAGLDPALAMYVGGLRGPQVRVLREHAERPVGGKRESDGASGQGDNEAKAALTARERGTLARAWELAQLMGEGAVRRMHLLRLLAGASPALAKKLATLTPARLAILCRAARRGRLT